MSNFKSNIRDIEFNLFEVFQLGQMLGKPPFENTSEEDARVILKEAAKFADEVFGTTYEEGDREGCQFDEGKVTTPACFKPALQKFIENSWHLMDVAEEHGGMDMPHSLVSPVHELFTAANPSLFIYAMGSSIANVIDLFGTEEQIQRFGAGLFEGKWTGTMCLTETDAGSDVGALRSKARKIEGDLYYIEGTKRFITGGEHDLTENIIHLVLARVEGAPEGTKGLSLFIVPKVRVNEDGSLGESNDVACAGIEHKMGFMASATCQLGFGENCNCHGWLLGGVENKGIRQMFSLMNGARLWTGIKAMGLASTAYLNALAYTKDRIQGQDMKDMMSKSAPRVPIIRHPDVRRMLMNQKSKVEAMRALMTKTSFLMDQVKAAGGPERAPNEQGLVDMLTPLVKAYSSEESFLAINDSLQCLGGSGYCNDYPIEQYMRDAKITSIYEGTTHIQALDLVARKLPAAGGSVYNNLLSEISAVAAEVRNDETLKAAAELLGEAVEAVKSQSDHLMAYFAENIYLIGLNANYFLSSLSELICGWLLLEQAQVAKKGLEKLSEGHPDNDFYNGKIATAKFFTSNILPQVFTRKRIIAQKDTSAMDIPEAGL